MLTSTWWRTGLFRGSWHCFEWAVSKLQQSPYEVVSFFSLTCYIFAVLPIQFFETDAIWWVLHGSRIVTAVFGHLRCHFSEKFKDSDKRFACRQMTSSFKMLYMSNSSHFCLFESELRRPGSTSSCDAHRTAGLIVIDIGSRTIVDVFLLHTRIWRMQCVMFSYLLVTITAN